jgi:hypothetical protein
VRGDDWCGEHKALAKRLDAQLTELLDDPLMANLATDDQRRCRATSRSATPQDRQPQLERQLATPRGPGGLSSARRKLDALRA